MGLMCKLHVSDRMGEQDVGASQMFLDAVSCRVIGVNHTRSTTLHCTLRWQ